jgi:hypothetical protein
MYQPTLSSAILSIAVKFGILAVGDRNWLEKLPAAWRVWLDGKNTLLFIECSPNGDVAISSNPARGSTKEEINIYARRRKSNHDGKKKIRKSGGVSLVCQVRGVSAGLTERKRYGDREE